MPQQFALFENSFPEPDGLRYADEFVSPAIETSLFSGIRACRSSPFNSANLKASGGSLRLVFDTITPCGSCQRAEPIPAMARSQKTTVAYFLKIIGPIARAGIDLLRSMRNEAAHDMNLITFDAEKIADKISKLQMGNENTRALPLRQQFLAAARMYIANLILQAGDSNAEIAEASRALAHISIASLDFHGEDAHSHRHRPIYEIAGKILGVGARIAGVFLRGSRALGIGYLKNGKQIVTQTLAAGHY